MFRQRFCIDVNLVYTGETLDMCILQITVEDRNEPIRSERQQLILILSSADGCRVMFKLALIQ